MLAKKEIERIREELQHCKRPLYFFHDDADGLASFLLLYRFVKEGHGIIIKTAPRIGEAFARKVEEYQADKVFILDIALVDQEFIDAAKVPVIWIDHHEPLERSKVLSFNPRRKGENIPVARICYEVVQQDLWIAMVGCIGDWHMPDIKDAFCKQYPHLLDKGVKQPDDALFESRLGKLIRILEFNLKGKSSDAMKSAKVLSRIEEPDEILDQSTSRGTYIYRKYAKVSQLYEKLLKEALRKKPEDNLLVFTYAESRMSFTKELSNELLHRFPETVVLVGRKKADEVKCSLRSGEGLVLPPALEKAFEGVSGYGGGHEHACGAVVQEEDFEKFVKQLKKAIQS